MVNASANGAWTRPRPDWSRPAVGEVELFVPHDWFDLLADTPPGPEADADADARFAQLLAETFPAMDKATLDAGVDALLALRAAMFDAGIISHGVVNCPRDPAADPAEAARRVVESGDRSTWVTWHVLSALIEVPAVTPELDVGELMARLLGQDLDPDASHVESFATEMGCGTGLIMQPTFPSAAAAVAAGQPQGADAVANLDLPDPGPEPVRFGLAAALASAPGGGPALLVVGMSVDPTQVLELGCLVAAIAGNSRIHAASDPNQS